MADTQNDGSPPSRDAAAMLLDWCGRWCESAESLTRDWQEWIAAMESTERAADAGMLDQLVHLGQPLLRRLQQLMSDRREYLKANAGDSLQRLILRFPSSDAKSAASRLAVVQAELRLLRREAAAQWIATSQLARSVEEILFIVRSGNSRPATYTTDELSAFQGGFVLDWQA